MGTGSLPKGDGFADVAAPGLSLTAGVNNFKVFVHGDGPDLRLPAGFSSPVMGTADLVQKMQMQIDYTIYSGLTVDEEGSVYVVSGGTPAGVGRSPSPNLGEVLVFPDASPVDRRADYIDLRPSLIPNPAAPSNVGDGLRSAHRRPRGHIGPGPGLPLVSEPDAHCRPYADASEWIHAR
jgi:hypothetical protein